MMCLHLLSTLCSPEPVAEFKAGNLKAWVTATMPNHVITKQQEKKRSIASQARAVNRQGTGLDACDPGKNQVGIFIPYKSFLQEGIWKILSWSKKGDRGFRSLLT